MKNNLQVVASLLNLHSRGRQSEEVAAAYASIQRRVDALAVVHRNHYAELEENRGVALKPLDLRARRQSARDRARQAPPAMQIRLDIGPFYATQDVAVSVAFLVTEIVEFGMLCGARQVSIVLERDGPGTARLSIEVDSLAGGGDCDEALVRPVRPDRHRPRAPASLDARPRPRARPLFGRNRRRRTAIRAARSSVIRAVRAIAGYAGVRKNFQPTWNRPPSASFEGFG